MKKTLNKTIFPMTHLGPELRKFESIVNNLNRDKADELMFYTAKYFKLKHVKTIRSPDLSVRDAADILCDDIEAWAQRQIYTTAVKKVAIWLKLIEISINKKN